MWMGSDENDRQNYLKFERDMRRQNYFLGGLFVLLVSILITLVVLSVVYGADAPPVIQLDRVSQTILLNLYQTQFSVRVSVAGGNGYFRNYVGLFASNSPTAVMLDWKYLDDTKDLTKTDRALKAGTVTFSGLVLPSYEARFYNWKPRTPGNVDELIVRLPIAAPQYNVERRSYAVESVTTTRVPVGNRDEVRILVNGNGNEERVLMDRGVQFNNRTIDAAPSAFASQP